jgi:hypothetical protein
MPCFIVHCKHRKSSCVLVDHKLVTYKYVASNTAVAVDTLHVNSTTTRKDAMHERTMASAHGCAFTCSVYRRASPPRLARCAI